MESVSRTAHAKVNLHLAVLGKRPDGYHELLTLFERIGLSDELWVERMAGSSIEFTCDAPHIPSDATNLAVRAAEAFRQASGWAEGIRIDLRKKIPAGGGLGGGSSDAAAVLLAMQELSGGVLPQERLMECARKLGADVAFFAADVSWGVGRDRGDQIEPLPLRAQLWHLLVTPDFPIPTKEVYQAFTLTGSTPDATLLFQALEQPQISKLRGLLFNSLEPAVESLYPAIRRVKADIEQVAGLSHPMVSGSGSSVFALCDSKEEAESAAEKLRKQRPTWQVHAVQTV